jgi:hypothetical protein
MSISQEIREAVQAARAASETPQANPFRRVLEEVAQGLTDGPVEAGIRPGPGGRWTLWLAPVHRPGRAVPMLDVVISPGGAEVLRDPRQVARTPEDLATILKAIVTEAAFLDSLQEIGEMSKLPVEGFLRMVPRGVSREDLMLEVPPEIQRQIAERVDKDVSLALRIANFRGAGTFQPGARYQVLESAGFSITLTQPVVQDQDGALRIAGRCSRTETV